jgi:hypothetical protein
MPKGFHILPEALGDRTDERLDYPLPSALPRL